MITAEQILALKNHADREGLENALVTACMYRAGITQLCIYALLSTAKQMADDCDAETGTDEHRALFAVISQYLRMEPSPHERAALQQEQPA